jgi:hypothetical protein
VLRLGSQVHRCRYLPIVDRSSRRAPLRGSAQCQEFQASPRGSRRRARLTPACLPASRHQLVGLAQASYTRIEQFTKVTESEVRQLHGMGPKAMGQIRVALAGKGLSFASSDSTERCNGTDRTSLP